MVTQQELRHQAELRQQGIQGTITRRQQLQAQQELQKLEAEEQQKQLEAQKQEQQFKQSLQTHRKQGGDYIWERKGKHFERLTTEQIDYLKSRGYRMRETAHDVRFWKPKNYFAGDGIRRVITQTGKEYFVSAAEAIPEIKKGLERREVKLVETAYGTMALKPEVAFVATKPTRGMKKEALYRLPSGEYTIAPPSTPTIHNIEELHAFQKNVALSPAYYQIIPTPDIKGYEVTLKSGATYSVGYGKLAEFQVSQKDITGSKITSIKVIPKEIQPSVIPTIGLPTTTTAIAKPTGEKVTLAKGAEAVLVGVNPFAILGGILKGTEWVGEQLTKISPYTSNIGWDIKQTSIGLSEYIAKGDIFGTGEAAKAIVKAEELERMRLAKAPFGIFTYTEAEPAKLPGEEVLTLKTPGPFGIITTTPLKGEERMTGRLELRPMTPEEMTLAAPIYAPEVIQRMTKKEFEDYVTRRTTQTEVKLRPEMEKSAQEEAQKTFETIYSPKISNEVGALDRTDKNYESKVNAIYEKYKNEFMNKEGKTITRKWSNLFAQEMDYQLTPEFKSEAVKRETELKRLLDKATWAAGIEVSLVKTVMDFPIYYGIYSIGRAFVEGFPRVALAATPLYVASFGAQIPSLIQSFKVAPEATAIQIGGQILAFKLGWAGAKGAPPMTAEELGLFGRLLGGAETLLGKTPVGKFYDWMQQKYVERQMKKVEIEERQVPGYVEKRLRETAPKYFERSPEMEQKLKAMGFEPDEFKRPAGQEIVYRKLTESPNAQNIKFLTEDMITFKVGNRQFIARLEGIGKEVVPNIERMTGEQIKQDYLKYGVKATVYEITKADGSAIGKKWWFEATKEKFTVQLDAPRHGIIKVNEQFFDMPGFEKLSFERKLAYFQEKATQVYNKKPIEFKYTAEVLKRKEFAGAMAISQGEIPLKEFIKKYPYISPEGLPKTIKVGDILIPQTNQYIQGKLIRTTMPNQIAISLGHEKAHFFYQEIKNILPSQFQEEIIVDTMQKQFTTVSAQWVHKGMIKEIDVSFLRELLGEEGRIGLGKAISKVSLIESGTGRTITTKEIVTTLQRQYTIGERVFVTGITTEYAPGKPFEQAILKLGEEGIVQAKGIVPTRAEMAVAKPKAVTAGILGKYTQEEVGLVVPKPSETIIGLGGEEILVTREMWTGIKAGLDITQAKAVISKIYAGPTPATIQPTFPGFTFTGKTFIEAKGGQLLMPPTIPSTPIKPLFLTGPKLTGFELAIGTVKGGLIRDIAASIISENWLGAYTAMPRGYLPNVLILQREEAKLRFEIKPATLQIQAPKFAQALVTTTSEMTSLGLKAGQVQIQVPQQPQVQIPKPKWPQVQIEIPLIPLIELLTLETEIPKISKEMKGKKKIKGWITMVKKKGKYQPISQELPRHKAIQLGERVVLTTLAASFKIKKSKKEIEEEDKQYMPSPEQFRTYKITKGKPIQLEDEWIERKTHRLKPRAVWGPVQRARAQYGYKHAPRKQKWF